MVIQEIIGNIKLVDTKPHILTIQAIAERWCDRLRVSQLRTQDWPKQAPSKPSRRRLKGARQIAKHLGWTERQVYQQSELEGSDFPLRKRRGIGLYAFEDELDAWERSPTALVYQQRSK